MSHSRRHPGPSAQTSTRTAPSSSSGCNTTSEARATSEEAVSRGAFGAPTFFVGGEMFFGNDRVPLVEAAILRAQGRPWRFHDTYGIDRSWPQPQNQPQTGWAKTS